jgi:magnesium chelatase family protein
MQNVSSEDKSSVTSKGLHVRVRDAYIKQLQRGQTSLNGSLEDSDIEKYCSLKDEVQTILDQAIMRFALSFRSIKKIQKIARTIADIENSDVIEKSHLFEALSYRRR